ncbi:MAG: type 4a pilus biogenesis protein PilO [Candidatus Omnitrophica bacterium]|nr:type 4a pilus biogenesis protein PilO [Candidatus Omnitrophota bacterium]
MVKLPPGFTVKDIVARFRKLDRKTKIRLLAICGGALLSIPFIFWPAWVGRIQLQGKITILRSQIELAKKQIAQEPKLLEEKKGYEITIKEVNSKLHTEKETHELLGFLDNLTEKTEVSILSSSPKENEIKLAEPFNERYGTVSYSLNLEGGYHQLGSFVSEIENNSKILRVNELSILPREEIPATHMIQMEIAAFYQKEQGK